MDLTLLCSWVLATHLPVRRSTSISRTDASSSASPVMIESRSPSDKRQLHERHQPTRDIQRVYAFWFIIPQAPRDLVRWMPARSLPRKLGKATLGRPTTIASPLPVMIFAPIGRYESLPVPAVESCSYTKSLETVVRRHRCISNREPCKAPPLFSRSRHDTYINRPVGRLVALTSDEFPHRHTISTPFNKDIIGEKGVGCRRWSKSKPNSIGRHTPKRRRQ